MILVPITILALALAVSAGLLWFGVPCVVRIVQISRVNRKCRREGLIALTYDDGPSEFMTDRLSALLAELEVGATFFMTGETIGRQDERVRRHVADHHDLGY